METIVKAFPDFIVWLAFTTTILAATALLIAGTIQMITEPVVSILWQYVAAVVCLAMNYGVRYTTHTPVPD